MLQAYIQDRREKIKSRQAELAEKIESTRKLVKEIQTLADGDVQGISDDWLFVEGPTIDSLEASFESFAAQIESRIEQSTTYWEDMSAQAESIEMFDEFSCMGDSKDFD